MVFLDLSRSSDGEPNVQHVYEAGREYIANIYKGMSPIPSEWGGIGANNFVATTEDVASYEVIDSGGIAITNPTTCFWLEMSI